MRKAFLASALGDFILVAAISLALSYTLLNGFYIAESLQYGPAPALAALLCLVALFAVSVNRRVVLVGGAAYAVALVVAWGASAALTPAGTLFIDYEENYLIFAMVVTLVPTLCFLASRSQVGTAVLFIVGAFLTGFIQLFYERFELAWTVVFVVAALALVIYKNYLKSMRSATAMDRPSFAPGFAVALVTTAIASCLGLAVWFGVIAPLGPEAVDIKLITEYRALETMQVRGTSEEYQTPDLSMTSDVTNDDVRTTDDAVEDESGTRWPATGETSVENEPEQGDNFLGLNLDNITEAFNLVSNPQNWPLYLIPLVIVALIALYFVLRRVMRTRRLASFRELGADAEYRAVFLFLIDRFRRVGLSIPAGQTVLEFGVSAANATHYYDEQAGVPFTNLTEGYSRSVYGKKPVADADVGHAEAYYRGFWKAARKQLGNFKYFIKSFRL